MKKFGAGMSKSLFVNLGGEPGLPSGPLVQNQVRSCYVTSMVAAEFGARKESIRWKNKKGIGFTDEGGLAPLTRTLSDFSPATQFFLKTQTFLGSFHKRTVNRSPSSMRSGSVPLCSCIPKTIFLGTPRPEASIYL